MLIVTNRNIIKSNFVNGVGNELAFGDTVNAKGPNEVRLAHAEKKAGNWEVRLVDEPRKLTTSNIPSKHEFNVLRDKLVENKRNCVFFVHGFNQSFAKNLEKALALEQKHNVEVVAFSWPSNPGGFKLREYRDAKRTAKSSVGALDATLEKLGIYLKDPFNQEALEACKVKFSFMTYSLGNFLFKNYVGDAHYDAETNIFENVILCQADVDNPGHAQWVDDIVAGKRIYVTINENDWVLKWSDANFQKPRLGNTAQGLMATRACYVDFTDGPNVGNTHGVFYETTNDIVENFFTEVFNGRRGENIEGLIYDANSNSYRFA